MPEISPKTDITLQWHNGEQSAWDAALCKTAFPSLQQSWAYGEALEGADIARGMFYKDDVLLGCVQVISRKNFGFLPLHMVLRGPAWCPDVSHKDKADALALLKSQYRKRRGRFLFIMPEEITDDGDQIMRSLGLRPIITGYSTVMLMLAPDDDVRLAAQASKWRNTMRKAQKSDLTYRTEQGAGPLLSWLLANELEQQSLRGYTGFPPQMIIRFANLCASKDQATGFYAFEGEGTVPVAGMLFLKHGKGATYHAGWTSNAGRNKAAHNLLLWEAQKQLRLDGTEFIDLGGVNTEENPGLARFKLGVGGDVRRLIGTYL